jgi:hypothetical protein
MALDVDRRHDNTCRRYGTGNWHLCRYLRCRAVAGLGRSADEPATVGDSSGSGWSWSSAVSPLSVFRCISTYGPCVNKQLTPWLKTSRPQFTTFSTGAFHPTPSSSSGRRTSRRGVSGSARNWRTEPSLPALTNYILIDSALSHQRDLRAATTYAMNG